MEKHSKEFLTMNIQTDVWKCVLKILLVSRNFDPLCFPAQLWYITFYIHYINFTYFVFNTNVCIVHRRGSRVVGITIGTHIQIYWWNYQGTYYSKILLLVSPLWEGTLLPKFMSWTYGRGRSRGIVMIRGNVRKHNIISYYLLFNYLKMRRTSSEGMGY